eukprot:gnl/Dysnectes_brevis/4358_a5821_414.p1 GENE.gnl/Dysnectes_brevis/4358_a5821_414~~gnl/Dysnectes_brevis/4358_a5821_414.p1  ORF type:complete len:435 (+),score=81.69 gnl/Dysnectes_brevis/4358_a5821_414:67-1371(+)
MSFVPIALSISPTVIYRLAAPIGDLQLPIPDFVIKTVNEFKTHHIDSSDLTDTRSEDFCVYVHVSVSSPKLQASFERKTRFKGQEYYIPWGNDVLHHYLSIPDRPFKTGMILLVDQRVRHERSRLTAHTQSLSDSTSLSTSTENLDVTPPQVVEEPVEPVEPGRRQETTPPHQQLDPLDRLALSDPAHRPYILPALRLALAAIAQDTSHGPPRVLGSLLGLRIKELGLPPFSPRLIALLRMLEELGLGTFQRVEQQPSLLLVEDRELYRQALLQLDPEAETTPRDHSPPVHVRRVRKTTNKPDRSPGWIAFPDPPYLEGSDSTLPDPLPAFDIEAVRYAMDCSAMATELHALLEGAAGKAGKYPRKPVLFAREVAACIRKAGCVVPLPLTLVLVEMEKVGMGLRVMKRMRNGSLASGVLLTGSADDYRRLIKHV